MSGLGVFDGTADSFDNGMVLGVNGLGINPDIASLDLNGRELNTNPYEVQPGIVVTRSILVSDASISAVGFARFFDSFTNTARPCQTITVSMSTNSGADSATAVQISSSGDTTLTSADFGFVLDDANTTGADSAVGFAYGDGKMLLPTSATQSSDFVKIEHTITLKPGETKSLLSFAVQNPTASESNIDYARFTRSLNDMRADNYLAGLSEKELSQIQNYAYIGGIAGTGPLGLTQVTDGEGNVWGVNNGRMGLQSLSSDVLRDFNPGEVLYQNFRLNPTTTISENGYEATYAATFSTSRSGSYSVMASPEAGFARVMLRIDYTFTDPNSKFDGTYGLKTLFASTMT